MSLEGHETIHKTTADRLVYMANQIAGFFETMPHEEAVAGVAKHINDFWEPRMRRQFFEIVEAGGKGLKPLVLEAALKIRRPPPPESGAGARLES
ncbi:MAG: formate dehydrogenase subunit delta [Mesorhizobium sp.]|jgi:formate dehydrogenase subunit delta